MVLYSKAGCGRYGKPWLAWFIKSWVGLINHGNHTSAIYSDMKLKIPLKTFLNCTLSHFLRFVLKFSKTNRLIIFSFYGIIMITNNGD